MAIGYCTVEDVRRVLREKDLPGDVSQDRDIALDAITGRAQWLRTNTKSHFFDGSGTIEDPDGIIPTSPRTRGPEFCDIPSTPHAQHDRVFSSGRNRYPLRMSGRYTKIKLDRRQADTLTALEVRDAAGGFEDWTTVSDKVEGAGEDYELISRGGDSRSDSSVLLDVHALPGLQRYDGAVRVTYEYGLDEIPQDIRRAVANAAASDLAEEAAIQIPNNAEVYNVESLADELEAKADDLLEAYR